MAARFDHLIIGSGVAGLTAAETLRQRAPDDSVAVVGEEPHRPYSRVMLPDVVSGERAPDELFLRPEGHLEGKGIAFMPGRRVVSVDPAAHAVTLDGDERIEYGQLLVATGCHPRRLAVPGAEQADVFYLHGLDDAERLRARLAPGKRVLVYGGGFVAMELAVACRAAGAEVTAVMRGPGFFHRSLTLSGLAAVSREMAASGVTVFSGRSVVRVRAAGKRAEAVLDDGVVLPADVLAVGLGIEPNVGFLAGSGLALADGVVVDDRLRASAPDIFAAGDVAVFPDALAGRSRAGATWQNAMLQGRAAALNMAGADQPFALAASHAVSCFGLPVVFLGDPDAPRAVVVDRDYQDGSSARLFLKEGRLVGATCVGKFIERAAASALMAGRVAIPERQLYRLADPAVPLASLAG